MCDRITALWGRTIASCFIFGDSVSDQSPRGRARGRANGRAAHPTGGKPTNNGTRACTVSGALALGRVA